MYRPSLWCNIERTLAAALDNIKASITETPTGPQDTPAVKDLMKKMAHLQACLYSWLSQGGDTVTNDLDDLRLYELMLEEGASTIEVRVRVRTRRAPRSTIEAQPTPEHSQYELHLSSVYQTLSTPSAGTSAPVPLTLNLH